jgi:ferredoxin
MFCIRFRIARQTVAVCPLGCGGSPTGKCDADGEISNRGGPMRVSVAEQMCVSSGQCALTAPSVFDQRDDDGVVVLITADPPTADVDNVREAAMLCPAEAISIDE